MMPEYFPSDNLLENVGYVVFALKHIAVICLPITGTLFMNGLFAPGHFTVRQTLDGILKNRLDDYKIDVLSSN